MNDINIQELQQDQEELALNIEDARIAINRAAALRRLLDNQDFIDIVEQGYFTYEAALLCNVRTDPEFENEDSQKSIMEKIKAIGPFRIYLRTILQFGQAAELSLQADQQTQEDMANEEATA